MTEAPRIAAPPSRRGPMGDAPTFTRAKFAYRVAAIAAHAAAWCHDTINFDEDSLNEPERREPVERFIRRMRERLDRMEAELGLENPNG